MNRRSFLAILGGAAAGLALEQSSGLWAPAKTFFLPPNGGWTTGVDWAKGDSISVAQINTYRTGDQGANLQLGDLFTIDGWYAVNPFTYKPTPYLQQWVVTKTQPSGVTSIPMEQIHPDPRVLDAMNRGRGRKGFRGYVAPPPCDRLWLGGRRAGNGEAQRYAQRGSRA